MTDYWKAIRNRLHEESALHYPDNTMGKLFSIFFNGILDDYEKNDRLFNNQSFLLTATGLYLDIKGKELGLPRKEGKYAEGPVVFCLVNEIPLTATPTLIYNTEENGIVTDSRPESVQKIITDLNTERKKTDEVTTLLECRKCTADFIIPKGTPISSDGGLEYLLAEDVKFLKNDYFASGIVRSKESGSSYNLDIGSITDSPTMVNSDLIVINTELIKGGVDGETDSEYRQRLFNNINTNISINYLKRQGIIIYSKKRLKDDVRTDMTSFNPYLSNKYAVIPPNNEVMDFVKNELITKDCFVVYTRGW